jgi:hypothetical protein
MLIIKDSDDERDNIIIRKDKAPNGNRIYNIDRKKQNVTQIKEYEQLSDRAIDLIFNNVYFI